MSSRVLQVVLNSMTMFGQEKCQGIFERHRGDSWVSQFESEESPPTQGFCFESSVPSLSGLNLAIRRPSEKIFERYSCPYIQPQADSHCFLVYCCCMSIPGETKKTLFPLYRHSQAQENILFESSLVDPQVW